MTSRRTFIKLMPLAGVAAAIAPSVFAAPAAVTETDPQAVSLGYKADTSKVDAAKFPKHTKDQKCGGCQLYQGKAGDASGPCPIFAGKVVSANGWCSAYVKKA
ncbi:MAG: high-potential iron-sulfur protein [Burkholderiales bacterium]|nr:high-potential iron-sulfur protein [Burkholderiales bacterium]